MEGRRIAPEQLRDEELASAASDHITAPKRYASVLQQVHDHFGGRRNAQPYLELCRAFLDGKTSLNAVAHEACNVMGVPTFLHMDYFTHFLHFSRFHDIPEFMDPRVCFANRPVQFPRTSAEILADPVQIADGQLPCAAQYFEFLEAKAAQQDQNVVDGDLGELLRDVVQNALADVVRLTLRSASIEQGRRVIRAKDVAQVAAHDDWKSAPISAILDSPCGRWTHNRSETLLQSELPPVVYDPPTHNVNLEKFEQLLQALKEEPQSPGWRPHKPASDDLLPSGFNLQHGIQAAVFNSDKSHLSEAEQFEAYKRITANDRALRAKKGLATSGPSCEWHIDERPEASEETRKHTDTAVESPNENLQRGGSREHSWDSEVSEMAQPPPKRKKSPSSNVVKRLQTTAFTKYVKVLPRE